MSIQPNELLLPEGNDRDAWQHLVDKYQPRLIALARRFPLDEAEAQDAVQYTWVRFLERHSTVRNPHAVGGWLRMVCRNECLNRLRQNKRTMCSDPDDFAQHIPTPQQNRPDEVTIQLFQRGVLQQALEELRPVARSVVLGSVVEKRPYEELSQMLDLPAGSIGPTRMRALTKLRKSQKVQDLETVC